MGFYHIKNTFINEYRHNVKFKKEVGFDILSLRKSGDCPESKLNEKDIHNAIQKLRPRFRETFQLFLEGFQYNEIAEKLDTKIGTIKSRIFLARKELMEELTDKKRNPMTSEVLKFRQIVAALLKKGNYSLNKAVIESGISWPTFQKAYKRPVDHLVLEMQIVEKIKKFNEKHSFILSEIETLVNKEETVFIKDRLHEPDEAGVTELKTKRPYHLKHLHLKSKPEETIKQEFVDTFINSIKLAATELPNNVSITIEINK